MTGPSVGPLLREHLADVLHLDEVRDEDRLLHLGLDSLSAARLVARLRRHVDVEVPLRTVFECVTVRELTQVLDEAGARSQR